MSIKISKEDLKSPDQMTETLRKGFVWTAGHSKIVFAVLGVFIAIGVIYSIISYTTEKKEIAHQESYFLLEKAYSEKKRGFEEADRAVMMATQSKDKKAEAEALKKKPTGDLEKDYGTEVANFEGFIQTNPQTRAAQMAALNLSEIYMNYKMNDKALAALEKVEKGLDKKDMLTALVFMQMGNAKSAAGDCQSAVMSWQNVVNNKALAFAHDETKLRMGLCYESMNDLAKAEQAYQEVGNSNAESTDFTASREAQKYLRLLKAKQNL